MINRPAGSRPLRLDNDHNYNSEGPRQRSVIDPTTVVRSALQNAASIAGLLLTTEALVSELPEEKKLAAPMPDDGIDYRHGREGAGEGPSRLPC